MQISHLKLDADALCERAITEWIQIEMRKFHLALFKMHSGSKTNDVVSAGLLSIGFPAFLNETVSTKLMPHFHRAIAIAIATSLEMGNIISLRAVSTKRKR